MTGRRIPVATLVMGIVVAALLLSGIVVVQTVGSALRGEGVDADVAAAVRGALIASLLALALVILAIALVAGRALTETLTALRTAVLARARGDESALPRAPVRELGELANAIERLSAHADTRGTALEHEGAAVAVLLDAISEGILQLDRGGRIVRANPAARALLNIPEHGSGWVVSTLIRNAEMRRVLERAAAGEDLATELTFDERRLIVSARPLRHTTNAKDDGTVVAFVDLTEVRRLESVRRDFVANVSHELKTPLTSIRGYTETLIGDDTLPAETQKQFLEVVHKNAERLQHIVDDLLDLSRLESGGWRPELHEIDLLTIIDDVWSGCSARAVLRNVTLIPSIASSSVYADPGGLRQVLANLLDNALRYTPDGGRIEIATHVVNADMNGRAVTAESRPFVQFEVRDNGAGIPSDALPRIFERFYRVDPARSRLEGGTGLGLSVVKHLVERMGGDITAESELGKGTTIRFRLPAAA